MIPKHAYYQGFSKDDFARDEYFREFVLSRDSSSEQFWITHIELYPGIEIVLKDAIKLVLEDQQKELNFAGLNEEERSTIKENIFKELNLRVRLRERPTRSVRKKMYVLASAAAILVCMSLLGYFTFSTGKDLKAASMIVKSVQDEIKELMLPDSSIVILNSNSSISYNQDFLKQSARKVFLKGNAFFKVKHNSDVNLFIVQTQGLSVEVYGTEFNVNARSKAVQVVLTKGSVKLSGNKNNNSEYMQPGDLWKLDSTRHTFIKTKINTELYTAWSKGKWIFHKTSLEEIAFLIKEYYDRDIQFSKAADKNLTITAIIPVTSLEGLLPVIEETVGINISTSKHKIIVH